MTDLLLAFVKARLDEEEATALAATAGPWWHDPTKQWHYGPGLVDQEFVGAGETVGVAATGPRDDHQAMVDATFIARQNPVRGLREVAVMRARVERSEEWGRIADEALGSVSGERYREINTVATYLRYEVEADASIWSDHPDYPFPKMPAHEERG